MKRVLAFSIAALMIVATRPVAAQSNLSGGFGGIKNELIARDSTVTFGEGFAEIEYQLAVGPTWAGIVTGYDAGSETNSFGLRWYFDFVGGNAAYPGIGVAIYDFDKDSTVLLGQDTKLLGGELLLEADVPLGNSEVPVLAVLGYYTRISGDRGVSLFRWGARIRAPILE